MVCKEDVLTWFKDLECYKRINVMFELLNMCVPFEIRFLGSCIEEIGKHSYQELRGPAIIANDVEKLTKDISLQSGLLEESTRHRILIYISLLSARNCACANWYYKNLLRTEWIDENLTKGKCKDDNILGEFILLFTLGVHHPAFTYEQKRFFSDILLNLLTYKEGKKRISPKPSVYSYPPGFGYPTNQKQLPINSSDFVTMPIKTTSPVTLVESPSIQHNLPGLPRHPIAPSHPPMEIIQPQLWSRSVFAATTCGAPEVPPFPPQPVSPLVSQSTTPPLSRGSSPHRSFNIRPNVPPPLLPQISSSLEVLAAGKTPLTSSMSLEALPNHLQPQGLPLLPDSGKGNDQEVNCTAEDKMRDHFLSGMPVNGLHRYSQMNKYPNQYLLDQIQALNIEGENSLHCSSSSSSSSINQSPPETPSVTPLEIPHGPGRGDMKPRLNGVPPFGPSIPVGICDGNQPPPPPPFSNCSVPYSTCYQPVNLSHIPNRSMFSHYSQPIRPHFNTPYTSYDNMISYVPVVYSSLPALSNPAPNRPLNCYNCGAIGHDAAECSGQTIEEITQKAYSLEYAPPLPEPDNTT